MNVIYVGCNPGDRSDAVGAGFYRLTFVPSTTVVQSVLESIVNVFDNEFAGFAETTLNTIGKTPVLYPIQDPPTIINDPTLGQAATIDCQVRTNQGAIPLQVALQAISDVQGNLFLYSCEAHTGQITDATVAARATEQAATATAAAATTKSPLTWSSLSTALKWTIAFAAIVVVGLIVWKAPKGGSAS